MKYIYILYSDKLKQAYIGSTGLKLKRRLQFHKNDNRRNFNLTCSNILNTDDYCMDKILEFEDISRSELEKIESEFIKQYKNNYYTFNSKTYNLVNKQIPYTNKRYLCSCGCEKQVTVSTIKKHLKIKNIQENLN